MGHGGALAARLVGLLQQLAPSQCSVIDIVRQRHSHVASSNLVRIDRTNWPYRRLGGRGSRQKLAGLFPILNAGMAVDRLFAAAVYPTTWNASAARNTVPSSQWRPISIMPTGSPADMPAGTVAAGWPVTSNGQVLEIISSARAT